jgi:hypothetical protein
MTTSEILNFDKLNQVNTPLLAGESASNTNDKQLAMKGNISPDERS